MDLSHDEKLDLMRILNWDYADKYDDMLAVINGELETSGSFNRERLLVRSMERLPWHYLVALWGVETLIYLYTPKVANQIWPKDRRHRFDFAIALLRGDPLPPSRWGHEYHKSKRNRFFSDRRNSS